MFRNEVGTGEGWSFSVQTARAVERTVGVWTVVGRWRVRRPGITQRSGFLWPP
jgi:hypothetical protein